METLHHRSDDVIRDEAPAAPLQREAQRPRERWLVPLLVATCTLGGVGVGFALGRESRTAAVAEAPAVVAVRDGEPGEWARQWRSSWRNEWRKEWRGHDEPMVVPPVPPVPPMEAIPPMEWGGASGKLVSVGKCDDEEKCTTIVKRKKDGSLIIVKEPTRE